MRRLLTDVCVCLGCKEPTDNGGPFCYLHESQLHGSAHRRFIGACNVFGREPTPHNLSLAAGWLAVLAGTIALREGYIDQRTYDRVVARYRPLGVLA